MPNKTDKSASRRRTRRLGMLAMLLSALLTPAGTIVAGAAVTAVLVGGVISGTPLDEPTTAATPTPRPAASGGGAGEPHLIPIEYDGQTVQVALAENLPGADPHPTGFESTAQPFATPDQTSGTAGPRAGRPAPPRPPLGPGPWPPGNPLKPDDVPPSPPAPAEPDEPLAPTLSRPEPFAPEIDPQAPQQPPPAPPAQLPSASSTLPPVLRENEAPRVSGDESGEGSGARRHAVAEPSAWGLLLLGGAALAIARRRRSVAGAA